MLLEMAALIMINVSEGPFSHISASSGPVEAGKPSN